MHKTRYTILRAAVFLFCFIVFASQQLNAQVITTIAGNGSIGYAGDNGPATAATLDSPGCVAADGLGNIYISDQLNNCVRKVNASGIITTVAGTGAPGYNGDHMAATASQLSSNWGIAADRYGNIYIADQNNNRIRKVDTTGIITTIAGTGTPGFYGDNGPALNAQISHPIGITVDVLGNVYIGDADNYRIRRIDTAGIITTVAGTGTEGDNGDSGPATAARIGFAWGLATDAAGYIYICDGNNNRVRRVDPAPGGLITTIAGVGVPGAGGDGAAATAANLNLPTGVFVNSAEEIFIADCENNRIRKINNAGIISTIAGTGSSGFSGDNGLATSAWLRRPLTVCGDDNNNIYMADLDNVRIREIKVVPLLSFTAGHSQSISVCQNTPSFSIDSAMAAIDYTPGLTDVWHVLMPPAHGDLDVAMDSFLSFGGISVPSGLSYTPHLGYTGNDVFKVLVTNGMLADTTTVNVAVTPLITTAGTITGQSALCVNYAIALTNNIAGGTWASDSNVRMITAGDTVAITGIAPGTDTVFYIIANACNADTAAKSLSILPQPDAGSISGLTSVCVGAAITLTDPAPGGAWSSANDAATISAGVVTGQHPGPALIEYTVQNTACISTSTFTVHVDSFPDSANISGPGSICSGAELALDGGTSLGTWSSGNQEIATIDMQTGQLTAVSAGTVAISYVVTNICGAAGATKEMTVNPLPDAPAITRRGDILCAPRGYAAYQWAVDGVAISWGVADTCKAAASGFYVVTVASSSGCSNNSSPYAWPGCTADDLEIYPNPTAATIYVDWCDQVKVKVTSADGRVLLAAEDVNTIDLGRMPDGVYMISVYDRNGKMVKTKRITKVTN